MQVELRLWGAIVSAESDTQKQAVKEIFSVAQTAFIGMLGFAAYFAVVLLITSDSDFILNSKETKLPVINVSLVTGRFFYIAPIVLAALYAYCHFFCIRLWSEVRRLDGPTLTSEAPSTLISSIALCLKPDARSPRAMAGGRDGWARGGVIIAALLLWILVPALLVWSLFRTQAAPTASWLSTRAAPAPALPPILTVEVMTILCLCLCAAFGAASLLSAAAIRRPGLATGMWPQILPTLAVFAALAASLWGRPDLSEIRMERQNLAGLGSGWVFAAERREQFRTEWCDERGYEKKLCAVRTPKTVKARDRLLTQRRMYCRTAPQKRTPSFCDRLFADLDAEFAQEWDRLRRIELAGAPELDIDGRNLRDLRAAGSKFIHARMERAVLTGAKLRDADFEGATLLGAQLDGAEAFTATFDRANLTRADLRYASLASSSFENAALIGADLTGADLSNAGMEDANLSSDGSRPGADLTATILRDARLVRADLTGAVLAGAILDRANLTGAIGLTPAQLAEAVGDDQTILPRVPGRSLSVPSCWTALPQAVSSAIDAMPDPESRARKQTQFEARLCPEGTEPDRFPDVAENRALDRALVSEQERLAESEEPRLVREARAATTAAAGASPQERAPEATIDTRSGPPAGSGKAVSN